MQEPDRKPPQPGFVESRYFALVTLLMLLIIVLLGWLWLRERRAAADARRRLADVQHLLGAKLAGALGTGLPAARALPREDLPTEKVTWNGRAREVFRISAAAGQRIGLEPNDVVLVAPSPATAPSATRAGPAD